MSTILKALRRLEGERQVTRGDRALRDEIVAARPGEPQEPRAPRTLWWAGAAGALLVALMVGALLWLRERPAETVVAHVEPAAPVPEARVTTPEPPAPAPEAPLPLPEPLAAVEPPPPVEIAAAAPPSPPSSAAEPDSRPYRFPDPEPTPAFEAPPTRVAAPAPEAPPSVVAPEPPPPEPRASAPEPARPAAPPVRVDRTIWHPDPARRMAVLRVPGHDAPATLREGDALGDLVVLRIEPSAVVFLHEGVELRRSVGEGP